MTADIIFGIVLSMAGFLVLLFIIEDNNHFYGFMCWLATAFGVILIFGSLLEEPYYKKGQVDALTGTVKYHLVTKPDSTKTWEEIKK